MPYEFVPYKFGAFSFASYADRRKLVGLGLVADDDKNWRLTATGASVAASERERGIARFAERYSNLRGYALVAKTYREYPFYAISSEIVEEVLRGDSAALRRIDEARPKKIASALLTIGYEGRSVDHYLNFLLREGVTLLCDVRRNAVSRKYGFAKSTLGDACRGVGIRYEHRPQLGISSERRRNITGAARFRSLMTVYQTIDLPRQIAAVGEVSGWVQSGERVALTCYERNAEDCHRGALASAVEGEAGISSPVVHL